MNHLIVLILLFVIFNDRANSSLKVKIRGPSSTNELIGRTARLSCRVTPSQGNFEVLWMKDGFGYSREALLNMFQGRYIMPGPTEYGNYDLEIRNLILNDDGEYMCQVPMSSSVKGETSPSAQLTVIVPPSTIRIDGHNQSSLQDGTLWGRVRSQLSLYCTVEASRPPANLIWYLDGQHLNPDSNPAISIKTWTNPVPENENLSLSRTTLTITFTKSLQGRQLDCRVANNVSYRGATLPSASSRLHVHFVENVKLDVEPNGPSHQYREHNTVKFRCSAEAYPKHVLYTWTLIYPQNQRQDVLVQSDPSPVYSINIHRGMDKAHMQCTVSSTLDAVCAQKLGGVQEELLQTGGRRSKCEVDNTIQSSDQMILNVLYAPVILDATQTTIAASVNDMVTLECRADANPPAQVKWFRNTDESSGRILIAASQLHSIRVTNEDVFGMYTCVAESPGFPEASKLVYLGKAGAPSIMSSPKIFARHGYPIKISCTIKSVPQPRREDVRWEKLNGEFKTDPTHHLYQEDYLEGVTSIIYITNVQSSDYGAYNCSVSNGHGHVWQIITLYPTEEAPLAFAIGSAVAVLFALTFTFIIVCIVKRKKCRSQKLPYVKGKISAPDDNIQANMYQVSEPYEQHHNSLIGGSAPGSHGNNSWREDGIQPPCFYNTIDRMHMSQCPGRIDTLRKVIEWRDEGVITTDNANGSTRSADSGVCPDESGINIACSLHGHTFSANPSFNSPPPPQSTLCPTHHCGPATALLKSVAKQQQPSANSTFRPSGVMPTHYLAANQHTASSTYSPNNVSMSMALKQSNYQQQECCSIAKSSMPQFTLMPESGNSCRTFRPSNGSVPLLSNQFSQGQPHVEQQGTNV